jgi:hypothetical protein
MWPRLGFGLANLTMIFRPRNILGCRFYLGKGICAQNCHVAMKRYPRRGTVSMYRGLAAESPNASRILPIAVARLCSKSTKVSSRPQLFAQFLPGYDLARVFQQYRQNVEGLFSPELNPDSVFAQFSRRKIHFENTKAHCPPRSRGEHLINIIIIIPGQSSPVKTSLTRPSR